MTNSQILDAINQNIKRNENKEITGVILNSVLRMLLDFVNQGFITFSDIIQLLADSKAVNVIGSIGTTTDTASLPSGVYHAQTSGTYNNASNIVVKEGYYTLLRKKDDGSWVLESEVHLNDFSYLEDEIDKINSNIDNNFITTTNGLEYYDSSKSTLKKYLDTANGNLIDNDSFFTSDFIDTKGYKTFKAERPFSFIVFYDKDKNYIYGKAESGQQDINVPLNGKYFRFSSAGDYTDYTIVAGNKLLYRYTYQSITQPKYVENINYFKLTAYRNVNNFNSIQELINSIKDASYFKRYIIYVPIGEWFECDLHGGDYIEIVGQDMDNTIIYCDGNSDKVTPDNYFFELYKNTPLNQIPQSYKHCVFSRNDLKISNLTLRVNDAKYCAHLDHENSNNIVFENVKNKSIGENVNYTVGIGLRGNQKVSLNSCVFETDLITDKKGVLMHNQNNQTSNCELNIRDGFFINCSYITIDELGSGQNDIVNLINCESTLDNPVILTMVDKDSDGKTFWINNDGVKESNPTLVPYSLKINAIGTRLDTIGYVPFSSEYTNPRPLFSKYFRGKYNNIF